MARPVSIQEDQILKISRELFMAEGYKVSTSRIARKAGISEGSLFKHFKTKAGLFLAAMAVQNSESNWQKHLLSSAGTGNIRSTLESTGNLLLQRLRLIMPRLMMISSSGITLQKHCTPPGVQPPPLLHIELLTRYFQAETAAGRLSIPDPKIQAHAFLGALSHYAWCETVYQYKPASPSVYVQTVVDVLLKAAKVSKSSTSL